MTKNLTEEILLNDYICPFINKEITYLDKKIFNMSSCGSMVVYTSQQPIDSEWPIKKADYVKENDIFPSYEYEKMIRDSLSNNEVTEDIFKKALISITSDEYKNFKKSFVASLTSQNVFIICPFNNQDFDENYEYVIKPMIEKYNLIPLRVDQMSHTEQITAQILDSIKSSLFVIADLTDEKQNCYYELGYAHSLGKKAIILAKNDTKRHFDISTYKWNYWSNFKDLKPTLEKEIEAILKSLGYKL